MKELHLVGFGPSGQEFYPKKNCEVWTYLNAHKKWGIQPNKHIITHAQITNIKTGENMFNWDDFNKLSMNGCELISIHKIPELKKVKLYPLQEIMDKFQTNYFASTHSYLLAYALHLCTDNKLNVIKKYEKIYLWGYDMKAVDEYLYDRFGLEFWIGIAKGLKIPIKWTEEQWICRTYTSEPYAQKYYTQV